MILTEIITEVQYEFLKLWYSCEWFIWSKHPESIFMISGETVLFEQNWKNNSLWCKYPQVESIFKLLKHDDTKVEETILSILQIELKIKNFNNIFFVYGGSRMILEEKITLKQSTPFRTISKTFNELEQHLEKYDLVLIPNEYKMLYLQRIQIKRLQKKTN